MKESSIIRVPIQKVDELMDMLGELLILNSQMEQKVTQLENMDSGLNNVLSRSAKLIRSIQGLSMSLRMVEIKPTLHRLTRIARDTAKDLKKRITIEIEGEDTEIDRSASEKLFDPLMHLVRNAVSHGIESEEDRVRFGKSKEGVLTMRVYSKRGNVYIEIEDDGQGINVERVLAKARKQGLAQDNKEYTEEEIIKFIFHPGFSTQEVINNISGRGVGMNVVEAEIHKMGGKVEIINNPGRGAKFVVRIPMNLAVLNGTVAEIEGGRYIFPTLFIKQFYIPQKTDWVVMQGKNKAIRVRDSIIPVITARDLFHSQSTQQFTEDQQVIILEMEQIVSKPLGSEFSHVGFATGAAILGDGNVSVILDIEAMFSLTLRGA
jgi:two-component system chemotaxis sensor kinase CheA